MKIPETSANVGAYYGNEENGQWQPNGVIIDSGVGGGVVGSGDAGVHRQPVYPVHIPRGHIPGYVMAGAYYPPPYAAAAPPADNFEDYMWMENEEEFDKQVMQQLEEEALMEQCIEAMLEDEQRERQRPQPNGHNHYATTSNGSGNLSLEETVSRSTLNPLAAEFVPSGVRQPTEEKSETTEPSPEVESGREGSPEKSAEVEKVESKEGAVEQSETEETIPTPSEPPEVSAADVQPIIDKDKKKDKRDVKAKPEARKGRTETKAKAKPVVVKSETKVLAPAAGKRKELAKVVKSEAKVDEKEESPSPDVKPTTPPAPSTEDSATPGIKPINYAAAAKANKPKKPTTPPISDKTAPQPPLKTEKPTKPVEKTDKKAPVVKDKVKTEKPVQRKNSTK